MNKDLKNKTEYFLFKLFVFLFNIVGLKRARHAAKLLALLFFYIIPIRKKTVIHNLEIAFPEYSSDRIREIAFNSYYSFSVTLIEILCLPKVDIESVKKMADCPNIGLIREKYNEQKGVILLTAHFGNWEVVASSVAAQLNIPMSVVVKQQRNELVSNWLNSMRETFGNKVIPLGISIRDVYKELKNKNLIGIVGDQRGPREGMRVKFFKKDTAMYTGPAALALKTGAPVISAVIVRNRDFSYTVHLEEIPVIDLKGSEEEKVLEITQRYMTILERYVKEYPEQWMWMHNRWKY